MLNIANPDDTDLIGVHDDVHIDPKICLKDALEHDLVDVVIIARDSDGDVQLWSSDNDVKTSKLIIEGAEFWLLDDDAE